MIGSKETYGRYGRYLLHLRKKFTESQDQDSPRLLKNHLIYLL